MMVRDIISPPVRSMGFKGSSGRYELPSDDHWALIGLQKSTANQPNYVKFTLNIAVVQKAVWDEARYANDQLPARPRVDINYGVTYGAPGFYRRLGHVMGIGDKWWVIEFGRRSRSIGREVAEAIRDHAVPAMLREMNDSRGGHTSSDHRSARR